MAIKMVHRKFAVRTVNGIKFRMSSIGKTEKEFEFVRKRHADFGLEGGNGCV